MLVYTVLFAVLCTLVFLPFILSGKSMIGQGDGQSQYILQLEYMGRYLREWASGILHGDFVPARYDFTIGMGDDINSVVRFHPLDFLSALVPSSGTETLYHVLIFLRMYLAGLAFSVLAFSWKRGFAPSAKLQPGIAGQRPQDRSEGLLLSSSQWSVIAGVMVYLFNGYTFSLGIVHPIYLSPLITLPLLLYAAERIMNEPGKYRFIMFSIVTALGFISNYYFMYIESIALLFYVLVRFFQMHRHQGAGTVIKEFFSLFVRMVMAYLAGLMMSAITLFPVLSRYFSSYRSERISEVNNLLIYDDKRRYLAWFLNLISPLRASGNGTHLNYAVIVFPAVLLLFITAKRRETDEVKKRTGQVLRAGVILTLLCLLIPAGGYVMAVFNNENNRWVFLIALVLSGVVSFEWENLLSLTSREKKAVMILTAFFALMVAAEIVLLGFDIYNVAALAQLAVLGILLCLFSGGRRGTVEVVLILAVIVSTVVNGYMTFGKGFGNLVRYYMDQGRSLKTYEESPYAAYCQVGDDSFYRSDGEFTKNTEDNASLYLGYSGVQMYNSVLNRDEVAALYETGNPGLTTMLHVHSLDGHTAMSALAAVRYHLSDEDNNASAPGGYSKDPVYTEGIYSIYENEHPLGMFYLQDNILPFSEMEKLNPVEREVAMLYAAVADDKQIPDTARTLSAEDVRKMCGLRMVSLDLPPAAEGMERTQSGYRIKEKRSYLTVDVPLSSQEECYLLFSGLDVENSCKMKIQCDGIRKRVSLLDSHAQYTMGRSEYAVRLGSAENETTRSVQISFSEKGNIDLDSLTLVYADVKHLTEQIDDLGQEKGTEEIGEDTIKVHLTADQDGIQCFSIPYSKGWKAQVDGKNVDLVCANLCFMGTFIQAGEHEIVLTYHSPGLTMGAGIAAAGILLILALAIIARLVRRRKET